MAKKPSTDDVIEATIDDLLSKKEPLVKTAYFIADADLADRWTTAKALVDELRFSLDEPAIKAAKEAVDDLRDEVRAATRAIRFKALGRDGLEKLIDKFPATEQQRRDAKKQGLAEPRWDPEKFPAQILAASAISPRMTVDQAQELWTSDSYNRGELELILGTALTVNGDSQVLSLGKEYERTES
jgi:hypothetical protein